MMAQIPATIRTIFKAQTVLFPSGLDAAVTLIRMFQAGCYLSHAMLREKLRIASG
jgi:hypothetical protein